MVPSREKDGTIAKEKDLVLKEPLFVPMREKDGTLTKVEGKVVMVPMTTRSGTFEFGLRKSGDDYFELANSAEGTAKNSLRIFQQFAGAATVQNFPDEALAVNNQRQQFLRQQAIGNQIQGDKLKIFESNLAKNRENQRFNIDSAQSRLDLANADLSHARSQRSAAQQADERAQAALVAAKTADVNAKTRLANALAVDSDGKKPASILAKQEANNAAAQLTLAQDAATSARADLTAATATETTAKTARDTAQTALNTAMTATLSAPDAMGLPVSPGQTSTTTEGGTIPSTNGLPGIGGPTATGDPLAPLQQAGAFAGAIPPPPQASNVLGDIGANSFAKLAAPETDSGKFPVRSRVVDAASNKAVQEILNYLGNPKQAVDFRDKTVIFGVGEIALNPGWRTKRDYSADVAIVNSYHWAPAHAETVKRLVRSTQYPLEVRTMVARSYPKLLELEDFDFLQAQIADRDATADALTVANSAAEGAKVKQAAAKALQVKAAAAVAAQQTQIADLTSQALGVVRAIQATILAIDERLANIQKALKSTPLPDFEKTKLGPAIEAQGVTRERVSALREGLEKAQPSDLPPLFVKAELAQNAAREAAFRLAEAKKALPADASSILQPLLDSALQEESSLDPSFVQVVTGINTAARAQTGLPEAQGELEKAAAQLKAADAAVLEAGKALAAAQLRVAGSGLNQPVDLDKYIFAKVPTDDASTPLVAAVSPFMDSQNLDESSSIARQDDIALFLSLTLAKAGLRQQASAYERFIKQRRQDVATRTASAVANSYSGGGGTIGFRIGPRLRALADPSSKKSSPQKTLERQSFPVLLLFGITSDELKPRIVIGPNNTVQVFERRLETRYTRRWYRNDHVFFPPWQNKRLDRPSDTLKEVARLEDLFAERCILSMKHADGSVLDSGIRQYQELRSAFFGSTTQQAIPGYFLVPDRFEGILRTAAPVAAPPTPASPEAPSILEKVPILSSISVTPPGKGAGTGESPFIAPFKQGVTPAAVFSLLISGKNLEALDLKSATCASKTIELLAQPQILGKDVILVSLKTSELRGDFSLRFPIKKEKDFEAVAKVLPLQATDILHFAGE